MKVLLIGGTGFIGSRLAAALNAHGYQISLLSTSPGAQQKMVDGIVRLEADASKAFMLQPFMEDADVIINLAGSTTFRRWNRNVKSDIYSSRVITTRNIVEALKTCGTRNKHFFNASGIGYYGYHNDEVLQEESPPGSSFLARMAAAWEAEALKAAGPGIRVVLCRFGIVLGKGGGALGNMLPLFRLWCGGRWGSGKQWFSWIHADDVAGAMMFLIKHQTLEGPVNLTAPNPVTNAEMARTLRGILKKITLFPVVPGFLMKVLLGECSEVFLKGQRVSPRRLLTHGFDFAYPELSSCLAHLLTG